MYVNGLLHVCQAHHRNITVRSKTFALEMGPQMLFEVLVVTYGGLSSFKKKCVGQLFTFSAKASRQN